MSWVQQILGPSVPLSDATLVLLGAYLLGGFCTGYYLVRWRLGRDIRELGSGSTGARTAGRVLGAGGFTLTVLGDFGKGALAVWVARHLTLDDRLAGAALLGVVAGHVWPAQLGWRGGKGAATSLGGLLVLDPAGALLFAGVFAGMAGLTRKTVVSGLAAFALAPLMAVFMGRAKWEVVVLTVLAVLVLAAHGKNLAEEAAQLAGRQVAEPEADKPLEQAHGNK